MAQSKHAVVVGSAIVFGVAHIAPPVVVLQFLIGLSAATLVYVHRKLRASLALHVVQHRDRHSICHHVVVTTVL
ncbi:CPBP family glutamic-type intramembrane protease [Rhodococcus sp. OK302]|uniref:CPBP family glutamic-type intramembrane protease n=1 Tax=Rhodococcus sp. OK302 TaxID=1882769 RepID=UPI0015962828